MTIDIEALAPCHGEYDLTYRNHICIAGWYQVQTDAYYLTADLRQSVDPSDPNFIGKPPAKLAALMNATLTIGNAIGHETDSEQKFCEGDVSTSGCRAGTAKLEDEYRDILTKFSLLTVDAK